jgi:hypothetical protein
MTKIRELITPIIIDILKIDERYPEDTIYNYLQNKLPRLETDLIEEKINFIINEYPYAILAHSFSLVKNAIESKIKRFKKIFIIHPDDLFYEHFPYYLDQHYGRINNKLNWVLLNTSNVQYCNLLLIPNNTISISEAENYQSFCNNLVFFYSHTKLDGKFSKYPEQSFYILEDNRKDEIRHRLSINLHSKIDANTQKYIESKIGLNITRGFDFIYKLEKQKSNHITLEDAKKLWNTNYFPEDTNDDKFAL